MDYNKIKEEIKRRNLNEKFFIPETIGISVQGFNKAIKNDTLKVRDLVNLSRGLKVPVAYWFKEEDLIIEEVKQPYGSKIERLNRMVDDLVDDKRRLKERIDELEEKLSIKKSKSKVAG